MQVVCVYAPCSRHSVPSPACGGETGRGHASRLAQAHPLPDPPPQAGEGAHRVRRGSFTLLADRSTTMSGPAAAPSDVLRAAGVGEAAVAEWLAAAQTATADYEGDCTRFSQFWL